MKKSNCKFLILKVSILMVNVFSQTLLYGYDELPYSSFLIEVSRGMAASVNISGNKKKIEDIRIIRFPYNYPI